MKLHNLFDFLLFAALSFALSACAQAGPEAGAPVPTPAPDPVANWIATQALNHPWLTAVAAVMGFLRMIFKPLMSAVHVYIAETATDEDNKLVARVEQSTWFKVLAYALDWAGSIKLSKPTNYIPTQLICAALALGLATSGCQSLSPTQNAALKAIAKTAVIFGLQQLGDSVKELRPYQPALLGVINATFTATDNAASLGEALAVGVNTVVQDEALRAQVLAALRAQLKGAPAATAGHRPQAAAQERYNAAIAASL